MEKQKLYNRWELQDWLHMAVTMCLVVCLGVGGGMFYARLQHLEAAVSARDNCRCDKIAVEHQVGKNPTNSHVADGVINTRLWRDEKNTYDNVYTALVDSQKKRLLEICGNSSKVCTPGAKGERGKKGAIGSSGAKGNAGRNGDGGLNGYNGVAGEKGQKGAIGFGTLGQKGKTGKTRYKRQQGMKGDRGEQGFPGPPGPAGRKGYDGTAVNKGDNGAPGIKGDKGNVGTRGHKGNGSIGPPGVKGDSGKNGYTGAQGVKGDPGNTGLQGPVGASGSPGLDGSPGLHGSKGNIGTKGEKGTNIKSCPLSWIRHYDKCYRFSKCPKACSPYDARDMCIGLGGTLISVRSEEENRFISSIVDELFFEIVTVILGGTNPWINGPWIWIDSSVASYSNWENGEPKNCCGEKNCMVMRQRKNAQWNNVSCTHEHNASNTGFVCEIELHQNTFPRV